MEVTRSGLPGGILYVAKHVGEDLSNVLVNAINQVQQTMGETAADSDQLKKHGGAICIDVQVNASPIKMNA